jgi:hypothetical protein
MYNFHGKKIINIEIAGVNPADAPDFCDAYIESAQWKDSENDLNDAELEELNEDEELVNELIQDYLQDRAEFLYELMNDK